MKDHRASADRSFIVLRNWNGKGVVLPMNEIPRTGLGPLVPPQPTQSLMVVLVQKIKQTEHAIIEKWHTVADEKIAFGFKILQ